MRCIVNTNLIMDTGENKTPQNTRQKLTYIQKVWQSVAVVAMLVVVILIARVAFNVLLMLLAGALIATYFHGLGDLIQAKSRMSRRLAMIIAVAGSFAIIALLLWFMGTKIVQQVEQLNNSLPHIIAEAKRKLAETAAGQQILDYFSGQNSDKLFSTAQRFFSTSFGVLGNLYIILFLGIFFTASPDVYKDGIILLLPPSQKPLGKHILDRISLSLKGWLKGMLLSIVLISIILTLGLTIIGIPAALVLALIAGMLKIIPNFGSLIAMIPGVLLALTVSVNTAIGVAILYIISQTIVSNIVTPIIQNRIIKLPPALTIISQVIMGTLCGALGIILAVPLLAILVIMVDELYVKNINKADVQQMD